MPRRILFSVFMFILLICLVLSPSNVQAQNEPQPTTPTTDMQELQQELEQQDLEDAESFNAKMQGVPENQIPGNLTTSWPKSAVYTRLPDKSSFPAPYVDQSTKDGQIGSQDYILRIYGVVDGNNFKAFVFSPCAKDSCDSNGTISFFFKGTKDLAFSWSFFIDQVGETRTMVWQAPLDLSEYDIEIRGYTIDTPCNNGPRDGVWTDTFQTNGVVLDLNVDGGCSEYLLKVYRVEKDGSTTLITETKTSVNLELPEGTFELVWNCKGEVQTEEVILNRDNPTVPRTYSCPGVCYAYCPFLGTCIEFKYEGIIIRVEYTHYPSNKVKSQDYALGSDYSAQPLQIVCQTNITVTLWMPDGNGGLKPFIPDNEGVSFTMQVLYKSGQMVPGLDLTEDLKRDGHSTFSSKSLPLYETVYLKSWLQQLCSDNKIVTTIGLYDPELALLNKMGIPFAQDRR